jgi:hypothetical protein
LCLLAEACLEFVVCSGLVAWGLVFLTGAVATGFFLAGAGGGKTGAEAFSL